MNPHTHYDIGFTHPQPEVIERLAHDMVDAIRFCEETADYAVFAVSPGDAAAPKSLDLKPELENRFYRIEISPQAAGWVSWRDKLLGRELLDRKAKYLGNQPIHERSLDGRDAITAKHPTRFERVVPGEGKIVRRTAGPVFDELVLDTSLPTVPSIRQSIRLYHGLKMVDVENVLDKQELFEPEGVYFAFPFDVPKPTMRVEIADASMRLDVADGSIRLKLKPNEIATVGVEVK
jgi:hypothetical protein